MVKNFFPPSLPEDDSTLCALTKQFAIRKTLIKNRTRGQVGEIMAITMIDRETRDSVIMDKKYFDTADGPRRLDCFYPATLTAIESKNCYVFASKFIRKQIKKDAYLLAHGFCSEIIWAIYKGVSQNAMELLINAKITVRIGWDEIVTKK